MYICIRDTRFIKRLISLYQTKMFQITIKLAIKYHEK